MEVFKNFVIPNKQSKSIVCDLYYKKTATQKPLVIFCHGYKGFKDWGVFGAMNNFFVSNGYALLKFNFSHNGGTPQQPIDFPDLEAFGNNNYTKELNDLATVIDWVCSKNKHQQEIDINNIALVGHSRGGGIATLTAIKDNRIKKLITWAAVSTLHRSFFNEGDELNKWRKEGVLFIKNGRTQQLMPHYIQFYEDYKLHKNELDIQQAFQKRSIPHLIVHGDADTSVPFFHAENLHLWNPKSQLSCIEEGNHVFGGKHPWTQNSLPKTFERVLKKTIAFLDL